MKVALGMRRMHILNLDAIELSAWERIGNTILYILDCMIKIRYVTSVMIANGAVLFIKDSFSSAHSLFFFAFF